MRGQVGRNERMHQKSRRKEALTIVGYLLFIGLILGGVLLLVKQFGSDMGDTPENAEKQIRATVKHDGEEYAQRTGLESILFIGYDNTSDAELSPTDFDQSDFLFLVVVDKTNGDYKTIHIDRDTMTTVQKLSSEGKLVGEEVMQIALSYSYGKDVSTRSANTVNAVTELLNGDKFIGRRIDHYVAFGMDSVPVLNDVVGGVSVEVPIDIDNDLKKTAPGEKITLVGDQALRYVRARETLSDPTNEFRMVRQRNFIESFIELFGDKVNNDSSFIVDVVEKDLANKLHSDDLKRVSELAGEAVKLNNGGYLTLEGEHKSGERYMEFYPDKDALEKLVLDVYFEKVN